MDRGLCAVAYGGLSYSFEPVDVRDGGDAFRNARVNRLSSLWNERSCINIIYAAFGMGRDSPPLQET